MLRTTIDPVASRLRLACALLLGAGIFFLLQPFFPAIGYTLRTTVAAETAMERLPSFPRPSDKEIAPPKNVDATLKIPKIGVSINIIEGDTESALDFGAWRLPTTSMDPEVGTMALAAHRYKRRPPVSETFYLLDKIVPGDLLMLQWHGKPYVYVVAETRVVAPTDITVLAPTATPTLTLITCTPLFSTAQRLVVTGQLL